MHKPYIEVLEVLANRKLVIDIPMQANIDML